MTILGFLNIDKPLQMTSHDVVARVRRGLNIKKVGHAGTLDPLATGVLVLCLGAATRLSDYVMHSTKRYEARVHLGVTTETYDAEGEIIEQRDASQTQRADVESALTQFRGDIEQRPPIYSAIKKDGRKLYELARAGESIDVPARSVRIDALEITDWQPPQFTLHVTCSSGTYIRSLAHDLGEALGVGAYLAGLRRTASGRFTLDNAAQLDDVLSADDWQQYMIPPEIALADYPRLDVDDEAAEHLRNGRPIEGEHIENDQIVMAYLPDGRLLAILRARDGLWKPQKVFT